MTADERANSRRLQTAQALVIAGLILYVPANILPVMTMTVIGDIEPLTVLGGVQELYDSGLWPIAGIVFLASIVVPFCKLVCLSWLLLMHGNPRWQRQRGLLRRIVHTVGSWSMVDVFLLSILVALMKLNQLATIRPGLGAVAFTAVVVFTMLAVISFDPAQIWRDEADCP